ncbi:S66 peptidase family protein [Auraticoccus monumenti]|uniref:Muramoyltetrapeptide carboxypeptidase n=1 Tax=Auraticoccus monumenti TaxID=675864 RepID=A0A1G6W1J3_9ACTN|nr:LD-carboxypeptidase [Auraticoccus monumenti]SDD59701.1 muramoyltetrapeptide carboxypeptidase [Auraticoccus monumenti]
MSGAEDVLAPLAAGARVALLAPSGPVEEHRVGRAVRLLRGWELEPVLMPSATARDDRSGYLAGSDELRAADLQTAWCDPAVDAVFCLRGGYGAVRLLDLLDVDAMRAATPKPLHGSSDVTALHEWLRERLGVPSWFSPMVGTGALLDDEVSTADLHRAVRGPAGPRTWTAHGAETLVPGRAEGTLVGGNLSLLAMTLGARGRPPLDHRGRIVLLEDVTEDTYRLDGYLQSLLRARWFDGVAGIALGSWYECSPLEEVRALALELLGPLGVPLVSELGFGHSPGAATLPLGVTGTLVATDRPRLEVTVPGRTS